MTDKTRTQVVKAFVKGFERGLFAPVNFGHGSTVDLPEIESVKIKPVSVRVRHGESSRVKQDWVNIGCYIVKASESYGSKVALEPAAKSTIIRSQSGAADDRRARRAAAVASAK